MISTNQILDKLSFYRPLNSIAIGLLFLGVALFFGGSLSLETACGTLAWISTAAFAYGFNDLKDVDIDIFNHPERPLVSGALSVRAAHRALACTVALALCVALVGCGRGWFWFPAALSLSLVYSSFIRTWSAMASNIMAAAIVTMVAVSAEPHPTEYLAGLLNATILFVIFLRELQKDLLDIRGDSLYRPISLLSRFPQVMWPLYRALTAITGLLFTIFYIGLRHNSFVIALFVGCVVLLSVMVIHSRPSTTRFQVKAMKIIAYALVALLFVGERE